MAKNGFLYGCTLRAVGRVKTLARLLWAALFVLAASLSSSAQYPAANYQTIIPHSATGGGFLTRVSITNLAGCPNIINVTGYAQSGAITQSMSFTMQAGATQEFVGSETQRSQALAIEWFAIGSEQKISASVLFDFNGQALQPPVSFRTAVGALATTGEVTFSAPVHVSGTDVTLGVALANLGGTSNTVNMTLLNQSGVVMANDSVTIAAFGQTAFALQDRSAFRNIILGSGGFVGTLSFTATNNTLPVAAVVIGNNFGQLYSLPVTSGGAGGCGYIYQPSASRANPAKGKKQLARNRAQGEAAWACAVPAGPSRSSGS